MKEKFNFVILLLHIYKHCETLTANIQRTFLLWSKCTHQNLKTVKVFQEICTRYQIYSILLHTCTKKFTRCKFYWFYRALFKKVHVLLMSVFLHKFILHIPLLVCLVGRLNVWKCVDTSWHWPHQYLLLLIKASLTLFGEAQIAVLMCLAWPDWQWIKPWPFAKLYPLHHGDHLKLDQNHTLFISKAVQLIIYFKILLKNQVIQHVELKIYHLIRNLQTFNVPWWLSSRYILLTPVHQWL